MAPIVAQIMDSIPWKNDKKEKCCDAIVRNTSVSPPIIRNHVKPAPTPPAQSRTNQSRLQYFRGIGTPYRRQVRLKLMTDTLSWKLSYWCRLSQSSARLPPTVRTVMRTWRFTAFGLPSAEAEDCKFFSSLQEERQTFTQYSRMRLPSKCCTAHATLSGF